MSSNRLELGKKSTCENFFRTNRFAFRVSSCVPCNSAKQLIPIAFVSSRKRSKNELHASRTGCIINRFAADNSACTFVSQMVISAEDENNIVSRKKRSLIITCVGVFDQFRHGIGIDSIESDTRLSRFTHFRGGEHRTKVGTSSSENILNTSLFSNIVQLICIYLMARILMFIDNNYNIAQMSTYPEIIQCF